MLVGRGVRVGVGVMVGVGVIVGVGVMVGVFVAVAVGGTGVAVGPRGPKKIGPLESGVPGGMLNSKVGLRVHQRVLPKDLEVEVLACGKAAVARDAEHGLLSDLVPGGHREEAEVAVECAPAIAAVDHDVRSVAEAVLRQEHGAGAG